MSRPRLLLLSSEFPPGPGGIGAHAHQLARHLTRLGWAVDVVAPQSYVSAAARDAFNRAQPFDVTPLPERGRGLWWVDRLRLVSGIVRDRRPDALVATGQRALWLAAVVAVRHRLPWLAVGHGSEFQTRPVARRLTRAALERAGVVVAVSDYTAGLIRDAARPRRLVVIPNAADGERYRPAAGPVEARRELGLEGRRVLLTVGQVGERKAQDVVIRALPRVVAACPDALYVMVGLPRREAEFAALAAELGVADHVRFAGMASDDALLRTYQAADLFVLVSRRTAGGDVEGYGIVVQEAALCGLPAVVSQGCGLTEAIQEGVTGVSVPPDDPEATATAIIGLLRDDARRAAMGCQALELAARATWAERVAEYEALLRELAQVDAGEQGSRGAGGQRIAAAD
ncbi:glycosyltransferase family 4 protein [Promineifilum sp.]|uniref:glycosyltransferase family 4 protein n=1 Tax=Promineifilum sp. TaxID=2664178 RepID=UPI0035AE10EA